MASRPKTRLFIDAGPISTPRMSGIGHHTLELIRALSSTDRFQDQYELHLVASSRARPQLEGLNIPGARLTLLPMPTRVYNRLPGSWTAPFLDLILGKGVYVFTNYRAWPLQRSPSLTFIYDVSFITHPETVGPRNRQFLAKWVPRWAKRSSLVAYISQNAGRELKEVLNIPTEKLAYVPCGVNVAQFYRRPASEVNDLAKRYALPSNYILYLGNIEPRKNLARLIRAYRALPQALKQAHPLLLVGGGGWQDAEIKQEIAAAQAAGDRVVRPQAYIPDSALPALYSGAAMLAHPALYEGFGITPLQAMACGTPVMAGNNSSMPEIVGDAAMLADVLSETELVRCMEALLTNQALRDRLSHEGPLRAQHYTWEASATNLLKILNRLR